jgi:hypothetical protein
MTFGTNILITNDNELRKNNELRITFGTNVRITNRGFSELFELLELIELFELSSVMLKCGGGILDR